MPLNGATYFSNIPHYCGVFLFFITFAPTRFFTSCPQLEYFLLFYHFSPNSPLCLLPAIGASSSVLSLFPQLASLPPVRNWSIFLCFITFPPTRLPASCLQLEHLPLFYHFSPNSPLCLLSAIGASSSVLSLSPNSLFLFLSTIGAFSNFPPYLPQRTLIDYKLLW